MNKQPAIPLWRVFVPICFGTAVSLLGDTSIYTVLPTNTANAGIVVASLGIMLSANRWIRLFSNSPAGWLSDRWPRRWVFVPAMFLGAFSTALYAIGGGYWPLLIGRLLWGIAWSGIWVSGNAIVMDVATPQNRGRLVGIYNVAFFTGAGTGSFLGGVLADSVGYEWTFWIEAAITAVGAIVALVMLPETKQLAVSSKQLSGNSEQLAEDSGGVEADTHYASRAASHAITHSTSTQLISANALMTINRIVGAGLVLPTLGLYLAELFGESVGINGRLFGTTTLTGLGLSLSTYLGMAFVPIAGSLSDRLGNRWRVVVAGLVPGVVGFLLLSLGWPWAIFLGLIGFSIASGSNQGLATAVVGDLAGEKRQGRLLGILFTMGDLGSAIGPIVVFALIETISLALIYRTAAVLLALMLIVSLFLSLQNGKMRLATEP
ncbi:MAG: MFS transporter [Chloroflexota bacterium]